MKKTLILLALLSASMSSSLGAQSAEPSPADGAPSFSLSTNLAYFVFSAFMMNENSFFAVLPLEAEIGLTRSLALRPELGLLVYKEPEIASPSVTYVLDCGLAWYPQNQRPRAWYLAAGPGLGYVSDSGFWLFLLSAEGGYQWLLGKGLLLGAGAGIRYVIMMDGSGSMPLPDLRLRLGWAF